MSQYESNYFLNNTSTEPTINNSFSVKLFRMLNAFVRHNNDDNEYIMGLSKEELESIYDDIYQMWLLAKLQLDYYSYKDRIDRIINEL